MPYRSLAGAPAAPSALPNDLRSCVTHFPASGHPELGRHRLRGDINPPCSHSVYRRMTCWPALDWPETAFGEISPVKCPARHLIRHASYGARGSRLRRRRNRRCTTCVWRRAATVQGPPVGRWARQETIRDHSWFSQRPLRRWRPADNGLLAAKFANCRQCVYPGTGGWNCIPDRGDY